MSWSAISLSSLDMLMQKFTSVKMIDAHGLCVTSLVPKEKFTDISSAVLMFYVICRAYGSGKEDSPLCDVPGFENTRMKLLRHVSFVDCPVKCSSLQNSIRHLA